MLRNYDLSSLWINYKYDWQMGSFSMRVWSYVKANIQFFLIGMIRILKYTIQTAKID